MHKTALKLFQCCVQVSCRSLLHKSVHLPFKKSDLRQFTTAPVRLHTKTTADKSYKTSTSAENLEEDEDEDEAKAKDQARKSAMSTHTQFDAKKKNKETFEIMIQIFQKNNPHARGVVEFITTAVKLMEDYNVSYDLETYKKLVKLLPEGKFVPQNLYQREFYHYPKQQDCILQLLDTMEEHGVCPDVDLVEILQKRFGDTGHPVRKVWRQLYWFPKFKNANPWPVPFPPVTDRFSLAKLAIERIVSVDPQSVVSVWQSKSIPDAIDDTFIINGQSPTQQKLLSEHASNQSLFLEGPFLIWVGRGSVNYFILRADAEKRDEVLEDPDDVTNIDIPFLYKKTSDVVKKPSVHEQEDGTILAVCATGTSSRDSLLSWIRLLEENGNPLLEQIPVIFSLKAPVQDVATVNDNPQQEFDTERVTDK